MIWTRVTIVYVTHTGRPIVYYPNEARVRCGAMVATLRDLHSKTPGRARQMRRMIAKAKRRAKRGAQMTLTTMAWKKPPAA